MSKKVFDADTHFQGQGHQKSFERILEKLNTHVEQQLHMRDDDAIKTPNELSDVASGV